jgi:hypothetical protein
MPVDLDEVRKRHERYRHEAIRRDCKHCDEPYPCDAIKLADEVEYLRAEIQQLNHESANPEHDTRFAGPYNERG